MRFAPLLTFIALALGTTAALASYPQESVRVCGVTDFRLWYGEPRPGIVGSTSTGLQNEYIRLRTINSVARAESLTGLTPSQASLEFRSAVQIEGVKICVTGDLYSEVSKKTPGRTLYSLKPLSFEVVEDRYDYLHVTQAFGKYTEGLVDLRILHIWDKGSGSSLGFKDTKSSLAELMMVNNLSPCRGLSHPGPVRFQVTRTSGKSFSAILRFECDKQHPNDDLRIRLNFSHDQLEVSGTRAAKNFRFTWLLTQVKPSL